MTATPTPKRPARWFATQDPDDDHDHREGRRLHAHGEAFDDVRRVAGQRRLRDLLDRIPARAGVVLGDADEQGRHRETDQRRAVEVPERVRAGRVEAHRHRDEEQAGDDDGDEDRAVERVHDVPAGPHTRELHADDRRDDRDAADRERVEPEARARLRRRGADAEEHHRDRGDRVGLEQVGGHTGAVADVVADVVRDHGRVARVVLRDPGLDLADEVGADVRGLRVDAAAESCEDRDERAAEREPDQVVDRRGRRVVEPVGQSPVVAGDAEEAETDDEQARDRAGTEGDVQRLREPGARSLRGTGVRPHGDVHADEPGRCGQDRADEEADGRPPPERVVEAEQQERDDRDHRDRLVLAAQVRRGALLHGARDLLHALGAGRLLQQPERERDAVDDRCGGADQCEQHCVMHEPAHSLRAPLSGRDVLGQTVESARHKVSAGYPRRGVFSIRSGGWRRHMRARRPGFPGGISACRGRAAVSTA